MADNPVTVEFLRSLLLGPRAQKIRFVVHFPGFTDLYVAPSMFSRLAAALNRKEDGIYFLTVAKVNGGGGSYLHEPRLIYFERRRAGRDEFWDQMFIHEAVHACLHGLELRHVPFEVDELMAYIAGVSYYLMGMSDAEVANVGLYMLLKAEAHGRGSTFTAGIWAPIVELCRKHRLHRPGAEAPVIPYEDVIPALRAIREHPYYGQATAVVQDYEGGWKCGLSCQQLRAQTRGKFQGLDW